MQIYVIKNKHLELEIYKEWRRPGGKLKKTDDCKNKGQLKQKYLGGKVIYQWGSDKVAGGWDDQLFSLFLGKKLFFLRQGRDFLGCGQVGLLP